MPTTAGNSARVGATPTAGGALLVLIVAVLGTTGSAATPLTEAIAVVVPNAANVTGTVRFSKGAGCTVVVTVQLAGLRPGASHGFHVHELGNMTAGCVSTGMHWNPANGTHGAPNGTTSHAGDLGNAVADGTGQASFTVSNPTLSLYGLAQLYGRAIVVHNLTDDLGLGGVPASLTTGNSGARLACAVVGRSNATVTLAAGECPGWTAADPTVGLAVIAGATVSGLVSFTVGGGGGDPLAVSGSLSGLRVNAKLGFHVHEFGDLSAGCDSTGMHWNPTNGTHGAPSGAASHAGDLGNVASDGTGDAAIAVSNPVLTAQGLPALIGRTVVVHNLTDDLGTGNNSASKLNGNAGTRIACAIIGIAASGTSAGSASQTPPVTSVTGRAAAAAASGRMLPLDFAATFLLLLSAASLLRRE